MLLIDVPQSKKNLNYFVLYLVKTNKKITYTLDKKMFFSCLFFVKYLMLSIFLIEFIPEFGPVKAQLILPQVSIIDILIGVKQLFPPSNAVFIEWCKVI